MNRIVFDWLRKSYGETLALDAFDLQVAAGEIVSIVGPSGCGKTTALNLAAGFETPTSGRVDVNGRTAVVFQQPALFPWLSVLDNVTLGMRCRGVPRKFCDTRARALLHDVDLGDFLQHYPYQLSGGMQQRVQIARALVSEPEILLMDEPFGSLDYQTRLLMQKLLLRLWSRFKPTILFVTHDVGEAIFISDRVVAMSRRPGKIMRECAIRASKPRGYDFLGSPEYTAYATEFIHAVQSQVEDIEPHVAVAPAAS